MDLADRIESTRFLGREFLVWLWYESEKNESVLALPEGESCALWLEEQLTLVVHGLLEKAESRLKGSTPSLSPEAKEALRQGKLPTKAKIRVDRGPQSWSFLFDADTLSIASVSIPALITEDGDERFYERMQLVEELEGMLGGLYERFLRLRTSAGWEKDAVPALREWVRADPWDE
jgi:hypothetical protein